MSSGKNTDFTGRINELQTRLNEAKKDASKKGTCIPVIVLIGALIPVLTFVTASISNPSYVQNKDGSRNYKYISTLTLIVSAISWVLLGVFAYYYGMDSLSVVCLSI